MDMIDNRMPDVVLSHLLMSCLMQASIDGISRQLVKALEAAMAVMGPHFLQVRLSFYVYSAMGRVMVNRGSHYGQGCS